MSVFALDKIVVADYYGNNNSKAREMKELLTKGKKTTLGDAEENLKRWKRFATNAPRYDLMNEESREFANLLIRRGCFYIDAERCMRQSLPGAKKLRRAKVKLKRLIERTKSERNKKRADLGRQTQGEKREKRKSS